MELHILAVDYDYLKTFDLEIVEGRFFSKEISTDAAEAYVLNETAVKAMGIISPVGKKFYLNQWDTGKGKIIGVVKDFHFMSMHNEIEPAMLKILPWYNYVLVKIKPDDISHTLSVIKSIFEKFTAGAQFEYSFFDQRIDNLYKTERMISELVKYFSLIVILISCIGLFGLITFSAQQRTKEIGIRKTFGASVRNIFFMLSREFIIWVVISSFIAFPAAWYAVNKWLGNFAYRINLGVGIFCFALLISLVITYLTIGYRALKAATANPVDSLRNE